MKKKWMTVCLGETCLMYEAFRILPRLFFINTKKDHTYCQHPSMFTVTHLISHKFIYYCLDTNKSGYFLTFFPVNTHYPCQWNENFPNDNLNPIITYNWNHFIIKIIDLFILKFWSWSKANKWSVSVTL
jgi:hypothetical protein